MRKVLLSIALIVSIIAVVLFVAWRNTPSVTKSYQFTLADLGGGPPNGTTIDVLAIVDGYCRIIAEKVPVVESRQDSPIDCDGRPMPRNIVTLRLTPAQVEILDQAS